MLNQHLPLTIPWCRLCGKHPPVKSHIIPKFVFKALKQDSITGYLRNAYAPNLRQQDGDTEPLLCKNCEARLNTVETAFKKHIFDPFHTHDQDPMEYGDWMQYFLVSLAWRTLVLDIQEFAADATVPGFLCTSLSRAEATMRHYLLGANHLGTTFKNHFISFSRVETPSSELATSGPNVILRRSAFGYTVIDKQHGYAAVLHNLAGLICVQIIKGKPSDQWVNTKIHSTAGRITQGGSISSWIMGGLFEHILEIRQQLDYGMSEKQSELIANTAKNAVPKASQRIWENDRIVTSSD